MANGIALVKKQRAILLGACGQCTYKVIRNLVVPKKSNECKYKAILEYWRLYYNPKLSIIAQQCKFNTRYRQQGESVAKFVAGLLQIAQFCGYSKMLEDMLCDCLVCGVNDT